MGIVYLAHDTDPRARRGPQGHGRPDRRRPRAEAALRARGQGRREDDAPERGERLRPRQPHRRLALHRDGAPEGQDLQKAMRHAAADVPRAQGRDHRPGAGGPRPRPPGRHRPPRHQAREHLHQPRRHREDHGLRRGAPHHRLHDRHRQHRGHRRLHVARAGEGRQGRRPQRPLQRRLHALRAARGPAALPRREPHGDLLQDHPRGAELRPDPGGPEYDALHADPAEGAGQEPRRALPDGLRLRDRPARVPASARHLRLRRARPRGPRRPGGAAVDAAAADDATPRAPTLVGAGTTSSGRRPMDLGRRPRARHAAHGRARAPGGPRRRDGGDPPAPPASAGPPTVRRGAAASARRARRAPDLPRAAPRAGAARPPPGSP